MSLLKELSLVNLPNKLLRKILFVLLLATSSAAQALTMGDFVVNSFLDKELQAEIVIDGDSGDNLDTIEVSIANEAEFNQAGILRSPLLDQFDFELVKLSDDKLKILVTTENNVTEPYIHMLLKIRWNGGQLLREFTALIDPPLFSSTPAEPVNTAKTPADKQAELKEEKEVETDASSDSAVVPTDTTGVTPDSYGPVASGETLSEIAASIQASNPDLSIYQIMYVLFQDNQSAFFDNNINNLQKGATLEIGDLKRAREIGKQEGVNFFFSQLAQWSAKNESSIASEPVSEANGNSAVSDTESSSTASDSGQAGESLNNQLSEASTDDLETQSSVEENPEFQVAATDVLNNAQDAGDGNNQVITDLKSKVAELEASVESTKLENEELKETVSLLESQLANSARLIELNNQELASLAAQNEDVEENNPLVATTSPDEVVEEQTTEDATSIPETESTEAVEEQTPIEEPLTEEPAEEIESEGATPAEELQEEKTAEIDSPAPVEQPVAEVEQQTPAAVVAPIAKQSISIVDTVLGTIKRLWQFLAIGIVGLLVIVYWKVRSNARKEDTIDAFESTFTVYPENTEDTHLDENTSDAKAEELINAIKADNTKIEEVVANPAAEEISSDTSVVSSIDMDALREATQSVNDFDVNSSESEVTKESSFLTVYNDGDVVVNADEIDPIAEADVYIAYGREDQGEEVLLDGIKNFPERNDIKIALLGLYAKSSKRSKFDEIYGSLDQSALSSNPEQQEEVEALKKTINGGNDVDEGDITVSDKLTLSEEASNTDFIVSNDDNELTEIDINSESFEISEIDFNSESDSKDIPVLNEGAEVKAENIVEINSETNPTINVDSIALDDEISSNFEDEESDEVKAEVKSDNKGDEDIVDTEVSDNLVEINSETNSAIDLNSPLDDEVSINLEDEAGQLDSVTIEVYDETEISSVADAQLNETDFSSEIVELSEDISTLEQEISEVNFEEDALDVEKTIELDISESPASITDAVDITAEISQTNYNDEASFTDVMELNVNDVDLTSIPDDQDLTSFRDNSVSELINDVDFVDEESMTNEVTVDLTETIELNDSVAFNNIDLDLGKDGSQTENDLPDGNKDPETQLDLAKVFLELDDIPGAVKILKELTGNPIVGEEAQELLTKNS